MSNPTHPPFPDEPAAHRGEHSAARHEAADRLAALLAGLDRDTGACPAHDPVLLDGGTSTTLEAAGHDLSGPTWSARLLADDPDAVQGVHARFLAAGARVLTTLSYQLSARTLQDAGRDPGHVDRLLCRAVDLARRAVAEHRAAGGRDALVAASVGPWGAALGGGAEYRGGYDVGVADLVRFHRPRVRALAAAAPDLLWCETVPSAPEVMALAEVLAEVDLPAVVTVTTTPDGRRIAEGQPLADALAPALALGRVVAVGVNCCPPGAVSPALAALAGTPRALVVKPNLGARWDPGSRTWVAGPGAPHPTVVADWLAAGVRLLGGCCGTDAAALRDLGSHVATLTTAPRP